MPKFKIPEGFEIPPDTDAEGEFTVVATFKDNGDQTITLLEIDGSKVKGDDKEAKANPTTTPEEPGLYARAKQAGVPIRE